MRSAAVIEKNFRGVDASISNLEEVHPPALVSSGFDLRPTVSIDAPAFVRDVLAPMMAGHGDNLPVGALPVDGTYPTGTSQWEKRNLALEIPVLQQDLCIQCGKCIMVCPHSVIRAQA